LLGEVGVIRVIIATRVIRVVRASSIVTRVIRVVRGSRIAMYTTLRSCNTNCSQGIRSRTPAVKQVAIASCRTARDSRVSHGVIKYMK
jgi:hypothetical protein